MTRYSEDGRSVICQSFRHLTTLDPLARYGRRAKGARANSRQAQASCGEVAGEDSPDRSISDKRLSNALVLKRDQPPTSGISGSISSNFPKFFCFGCLAGQALDKTLCAALLAFDRINLAMMPEASSGL